MNGLKIVGLILLWLGFLAAALASVSQREVDFLPDAEKASLDKLTDEVTVSRAELDELASKPIPEMDSQEFADLVDKLAPILNQRAVEKHELAKVTASPIDQLSSESLDLLVERVVPRLKTAALAREKEKAAAEKLKKDGQEPPSQTDEDLIAAAKSKKQVKKEDIETKRVQRISNRWPTVPWLWYGLSIAVGVAGVFCLRSSSKAAEEDTSRVDEEYTILTNSMDLLHERVGRLKNDLKNMRPGDVVAFIDSECSEAFSDFADARNALIQKFGLQGFADVMTQFASGERFVNRAWSASADGYMNEAQDCLDRAHAHLVKAVGLIKELESQPTER